MARRDFKEIKTQVPTKWRFKSEAVIKCDFRITLKDIFKPSIELEIDSDFNNRETSNKAVKYHLEAFCIIPNSDTMEKFHSRKIKKL